MKKIFCDKCQNELSKYTADEIYIDYFGKKLDVCQLCKRDYFEKLLKMQYDFFKGHNS